jgi:hypothetical protein
MEARGWAIRLAWESFGRSIAGQRGRSERGFLTLDTPGGMPIIYRNREKGLAWIVGRTWTTEE